MEVNHNLSDIDYLKVAYDKMAQRYINELDFSSLANIRSKNLMDLTQDDLETLGCVRIKDPEGEWEEFYNYTNLNFSKIYLNKCADRYELRGYRLKKIKDILTTEELIIETLYKWRLHVDGGELIKAIK